MVSLKEELDNSVEAQKYISDNEKKHKSSSLLLIFGGMKTVNEVVI